MTCPGCNRDVTLLGGYCGHCSNAIAAAITAALDDVSALDTFEIVDVAHHDDGYLHVRIDDKVETSEVVVGYRVEGTGTSPLFCPSCADDAPRDDLQALTVEDLARGGFTAATCASCGETFYEPEGVSA